MRCRNIKNTFQYNTAQHNSSLKYWLRKVESEHQKKKQSSTQKSKNWMFWVRRHLFCWTKLYCTGVSRFLVTTYIYSLIFWAYSDSHKNLNMVSPMFEWGLKSCLLMSIYNICELMGKWWGGCCFHIKRTRRLPSSPLKVQSKLILLLKKVRNFSEGILTAK